MDKYTLVKEDTKIIYNTTLYRIKALKDFGNVKRGDLGGYIESEKNLSQEGDCWVFGDARVFENARVFGNAEVYGNAKVYGNATVCGYARVLGDARVYGNAEVSGDARVYGDARVSGNARVYGNARVSNKTQLSKSHITSTPFGIQGSRDYINLDGDYIHIGCQCHKIDYWLENYEDIGRSNDYSDSETTEYGDLIKIAVNYKARHSKEVNNV